MRIPWDDIPIGYGDNCLSPESVDLIKKFLNPNPIQRLGSNGIEEIENHPFFKGYTLIK